MENGIPRLIVPGSASAEQMRQAAAFDALFQDKAARELHYQQLPEADAMRAAAGACAGQQVLDVGCGNGQRMPRLPAAASVMGLDLSRDGLYTFQQPVPSNVHRVQADALRLPFSARSFDTVLCGQTLPHVTGEGARERAVQELARVVKPDGRVLISTLHFNFRFPLLGKKKTGLNEDGVWFLRDTLDEFQQLLSPCFTIDKIWGYWIYLPHTYGLVIRMGRGIVYWDRLWRTHPRIALRYGKILLAFCRPR